MHFRNTGPRSRPRFSVQGARQALPSRKPTRVGLQKFFAAGTMAQTETKARLAPLGLTPIRLKRGLGHSRRRAPHQDRQPIGGKVRCGVSVYAPNETFTHPLGTKCALTIFNRSRKPCAPRAVK